MKKQKILNLCTKNLRKSQACTLAVEEISELITEISLNMAGETNYEDLCEEVADVKIMTGLVMTTFDISRKEIETTKNENREKFVDYTDSHSYVFNMKSCIYELAKFQKAICKKARGRHNRKDLVDSISAVELSIEYLCDVNLIDKKDCDKWEKKKMKRMQKRIRKHQIV